MADRGRDLKVSILSDAAKFDLSDPADDLEQLADAAKDTGRDLNKFEADSKDAAKHLDNLGKDAKDAGKHLDSMGKDAKDSGKHLDNLQDDARQTADKVEKSFKQIGDASKKIDTDTRDSVDGASESMDEFKDEANSTAKEAAASFSGSADDIIDAFQEVAANAFAGFGPAGALAGMAAAAGIGVVFSKLQASAEQAEALKEQITSLAAEIDDAGGNLDKVNFAEKIREWSLATKDNKSWWEIWQKAAKTNIEVVAEQAKSAKVNFVDLLRGMSGSDSEAAKRSLAELNDKISDYDERIKRASNASMATSLQNERAALVDLRDSLQDASTVTDEAVKAQEQLESVLGASLATMQAYDDAVGSVADTSDDMAEAVENAAKRQADATADASDSVENYRDTAVASYDDVIAAQQRQLEAAANFQHNTQTVFQRLGQDAVDWALAQGDAADDAMQMLANAPVEKGRQIAQNYRDLGRLNSSNMVGGLKDNEGAARAAGDALAAAVASGVRGRQGDARNAAQSLLGAIQAEINRNPMRVPITMSQNEFKVKVYTDIVQNTYRRTIDMPV